jgi:ketosteroid isomerase-like protein
MTPSPDFADWVAITELKARYCRLLDTKDWDGYAALFTDDAVLDTSPAGGYGPIEGRDNFVPMIQSSLATAKTAHQVHSPEVWVDGDVAHVTWAMQDRVHMPERGMSFTGYGHYHERYRRTVEGWRIAYTELTRLHVDAHPVAD